MLHTILTYIKHDKSNYVLQIMIYNYIVSNVTALRVKLLYLLKYCELYDMESLGHL